MKQTLTLIAGAVFVLGNSIIVEIGMVVILTLLTRVPLPMSNGIEILVAAALC